MECTIHVFEEEEHALGSGVLNYFMAHECLSFRRFGMLVCVQG